jgi:hypothetical protein
LVKPALWYSVRLSIKSVNFLLKDGCGCMLNFTLFSIVILLPKLTIEKGSKSKLTFAPLQNNSSGLLCFISLDNLSNASLALLKNLSKLLINSVLFFKKTMVFLEMYLKKLSLCSL